MVPGGPLGSPVPAAPRRRAGVRGWVALAVAVLLVVAGGVVGTILLWPDEPPPPVPGKPTTGLELTDPSDLTIGPDGALYVADDGGNKVIRVTSAGVVERVAGTGTSGDSGDGRAATGAELNSPEALAVGPDGSVYIAVSGRIRRVDPAGLIRPVTGFDPSLTANAVEVSADSDGNDTLFVATDDAILMRDPQGTVTTVVSDFPGVRDLLHEPNGSLLASVSNGGINQVVRITTSTDGTGPTETVVAGADADATDAPDGDSYPPADTKLSSPGGLAVDRQSRLYFSETGPNRVRRVQEDGTLLTLAGDPDEYSSGDEGDGGDAILATFNLGNGAIAVDANGKLYIADGGNGRVRTVDPAGIVEAYG